MAMFGEFSALAYAAPAASLVLLATTYKALDPISCYDVQQCTTIVEMMPRRYHGYLAVGLFALCLREATAVLAAWAPQRKNRSGTQGYSAPFLLSLILGWLGAVQAGVAWTEVPWVHTLDGRPVFTVRSMEWLISVPLLLLLTGHCGLNRPLKELAPAIIITQLYIIGAWLALLVADPTIRWGLIAGSFVAYIFASYDMLGWVLTFVTDDTPEAPCKTLRASGVFLLIIVFAMYGVVYLLAEFEAISPALEQGGYAVFGFGCKLSMSMLFTAIRVLEYELTTEGLLCRLSGTGTAFMSLLRCHFDFVLPVKVDASGVCRLPTAHEGDTQDLESFFGRSVLGCSLNEFLAGPYEQQRFAGYVQNASRQQSLVKELIRSDLEGQRGQMPPVAQVLRVTLDVLNKEESSKGTDRRFTAGVYLSAVPRSDNLDPADKCMILGVRLDAEDSATAEAISFDRQDKGSEVHSTSEGPTESGHGQTQGADGTSSTMSADHHESVSQAGEEFQNIYQRSGSSKQRNNRHQH